MNLRRLFVNNIPFFRRLDTPLITKITLLMSEQCFTFNELVFKQNSHSDSIMIVMQGTLTMRVMHCDERTGKLYDLIFGYLYQGACFNAYHCFAGPKKKSLLSFFSADKKAVVGFIKVKDLLALGGENPIIKGILNEVRFKVKHHLTDDIDFFPFPLKCLEGLNLAKKPIDLIGDSLRSRVQKKKTIIQTKAYFIRLGKGEIELPVVLDVIRKNQEDRALIMECEQSVAATIKETRTQFEMPSVYDEYTKGIRDKYIQNIKQKMVQIAMLDKRNVAINLFTK